MTLTRRRLLAGTVAALALPLVACSTGPAGQTGEASPAASTDAFPVTVTHAFGKTTIPAAPTR
ncbi:MAG: ABC transporter substrate-binding protein, partial [Actinomycetes bacterium]